MAAAIGLWLGGCALAPGMHAVDAQLPPMTWITPETIAQQAAAQMQPGDEASAAFGVRSAGYRVGAADVLSISVLNHPELLPLDVAGTNGGSARPAGFVVDGDGGLSYPYVGKLAVAGKTIDGVRDALTIALAQYIRKPQVAVRVAEYRSQRVYVDGAVRAPGKQPVTDVPMTLAQALADAGGITASGDASELRLSRAGRTYRVDLPALARAGVEPDNLYLSDRDRVWVAERADRPVFVAGEVGQPRPVPMRDGVLSLGEALAQAGSLSQIAADASSVYVVRQAGAGEEPEVFRLNATSPAGLSLASRFPLRANDLVYVQASGLVRWNRVMNLLLSGSLSLYNTQRAVDTP